MILNASSAETRLWSGDVLKPEAVTGEARVDKIGGGLIALTRFNPLFLR
jgi:hypothetical protein